jgi:hypothetical protein
MPPSRWVAPSICPLAMSPDICRTRAPLDDLGRRQVGPADRKRFSILINLSESQERLGKVSRKHSAGKANQYLFCTRKEKP